MNQREIVHVHYHTHELKYNSSTLKIVGVIFFLILVFGFVQYAIRLSERGKGKPPVIDSVTSDQSDKATQQKSPE